MTSAVTTVTAERSVMTGGEAMMQSLVDHDVRVIFGYPGGAVMPTFDALYRFKQRGQLTSVLPRHEQGATHMAEGYARVSGEPGVVLVTSGPGATNTLTGIADALMDSTPMIVIAGQVATPKIGTQAFQEAPIVDMAKPVTKWSYQLQPGDNIRQIMDRAFDIATSGRPGPVFIDLPRDIQVDERDYPSAERFVTQPPVLDQFRLAQLQHSAKILNEAQRPMILIGQGVQISNAERALIALAEKSGIPVASTLHGLSTMPDAHPNFVGMVGMHGRLGANTLTNSADALLVVGGRLDDRVVGRVNDYAKNAWIGHIDISPAQLDLAKSNGVNIDTSINLDARTALTALLGRIDQGDHYDWLSRFRQYDAEEERVVTSKALSPGNTDLTMDEVIHSLSKMTSGEAIIVPDVGQHQMVVAQRYALSGRSRSFISSGGMGTMGFALPAAIGAKIAAPERTVVMVAGDGSFQMNSQEMQTLHQEGLDVKMIVLNNSHLGMVRQWQDRFFGGRLSEVALDNPNFPALAAAYGIEGSRVDSRSDLSLALDRMLTSRGSYLLEVAVGKKDNVFPMMIPGAAVDEMVLE